MLLGEPATSTADLHFRIFGFPVRVHPYFWVVSLLLGMGGLGGGKANPADVLIWVVVVFVSILVHELGHAFTQRFYGGHPWITLYSFGGLASCNDCADRPRSQIIIALAGPVAGFLLAALLFLLVRLTGQEIGFATTAESVQAGAYYLPLGPFTVYWEPVTTPVLNTVIGDLLQVNILWGLINLLPIYPLDGGRVAREVLTIRHPRQGIIRSLQLSIGTAALVAVYGLLRSDLFAAIMFGLFAYSNYQALAAYRDGWQ